MARGEELHPCDSPRGGAGQKEKIFVSVRLRPASERERARKDIVTDWECVNSTTIFFKSSIPERSLFPSAHMFDRVFGSDCSTREVYEEGAKEVALAVLDGINSSIFAYGQTSSGKTYTMSGITKYTVADIFDYMEKHPGREYTLKFSAIEIYNESVRDLLSADSLPLRLLDDPEKGTVIEKLIEETIEDQDHFHELISICEAQRQIGETSLNEMSSRSHQILRLTVVSSESAYGGAENAGTLAASVNFVDLAGSERASQTLSAGQRLKEGSHINRSLLTLGTVIRKLSTGRNSHIPYRDSKLTRILQNSLGGNAKTAIICTLNPARSHVEQSRNTLLFASCAKEVTMNAHVNIVMSDKTLVKQLQRELARLENEMRGLRSSTPVTIDSAADLKEKELLIAKMEMEIAELTRQRDIAQSKVQELLQEKQYELLNPEERSIVEAMTDQAKLGDNKLAHEPDNRMMERMNSQNLLQFAETAEDNFLLDGSSPRLSLTANNFVELGPDPSKSWEDGCETIGEDTDGCREVKCIEIQERPSEIEKKPDQCVSPPDKLDQKVDIIVPVKGESEKGTDDVNNADADVSYESLKKKIQDMQKTINCLLNLGHMDQSPDSSETDTCSSRSLKVTRSRSCRATLVGLSKSPEEQKTGTPASDGSYNVYQRTESSFSGEVPSSRNLPRKDSRFSGAIHRSNSEDLMSLRDFGFNGMTGLHSKTTRNMVPADRQTQRGQDLDLSTSRGSSHPSIEDWSSEFESRRREIIALWDLCDVPLVHRSYFFLLFRGDPSDAVYIEVELRRLSFLKSTSAPKGSQGTGKSSSSKALSQEREMLSRRILKKHSRKERESLYEKWGVSLNTKQRSLQVARKLWTNTEDIDHSMESAQLVAKLLGMEVTSHVQKEMFELSFSPKPPINKRKSFSWRT
ncbi:hypothetical protein MLD38_002117 [Melastoma candidum]|uniref:Uncharacterized protein n=1 Tax=Melastoma candidum TaxID=119954 RepID=A0ACB9SFE1_9MYRT|nr:hypothetical protein MLD38_002117 [Melastoma candidum]